MEIEAKFCVPEEETFLRLSEVTALAGYDLGEPSVLELHDDYLDTADRAILASGYACRLRRCETFFVATLKELGNVRGAVHRRTEYEVQLAGPLPPQEWPSGPAHELAITLSGGKPLIKLFDIEQTRHGRPVRDGSRLVAELNLDRVVMGLANSDKRPFTFLELEAELMPDGVEKDLDNLATNLQEEWGLTPETRSKYERGLALVDPGLQPGTVKASPVKPGKLPGIEPDDPMSEAGRKTLRVHYRLMLYHEPGTRQGQDIEELHDMRVATRRMRSAFWVFGDHFHHRAVAGYVKALKRTGRALGLVRDLDVLRAKTETYLATLPASQADSLASFMGVLQERREVARDRMLAYLDGPKYRRFVEQFGEFVDTEGMGSRRPSAEGDDPRPYRVRHVAPMAIYERLAFVRAFDEWVSVSDPPLSRLHALRIACKRLRYTLEFFREVLGPDTRTLIREIVAMQDHLGDLQDATVASSILRDYLVWGTWGDEPTGRDDSDLNAPLVASGEAAYLAAKQSELQRLVDGFPQAWQRFQASGFVRSVADAVSAL